MKWIGHVACMRKMMDDFKVLVGKAKKEPVGNSRYKWEYNI
jgi:hypothetical protein